MKLGLHIPATDWEGGAAQLGSRLAEIVAAAEAAGFEAISVSDHVWGSQYTGGIEASQIEAYTTLGFIAAHTHRVRLLTLVTAATYRHPGLLAKMVTTLDVLSGGRAMLGIGVGNYPQEALGLGLPFPSLPERFELLEETVQVCLRMWEGERGDGRPFQGRHVQLGRAINAPQSLSRPHPPIMIAGGGERRTLPLVARYADACNLPPSPDVPRKLDLLRRLCEREGRDYSAIEKTAPFRFDVGPDGSKVDELLAQLRWLAGMGIEMVFGWVVGVDRIRPIEIMGREVIPAAAEMGAG
ncbi:Luciferase-like monooxygenase [Thermobaculum terrenum ATCC BAA-798]|uniref:Luciferase-like monooxygenase n=1 Tax=Thermobaculum terrenum (strain ATCC BAA-798 / CCMEE 7001 / YNP1) TaxID=525904 RepID=D1CIV2_THET1|nr:TIGR03560 family F420-dependent LLM class oxidoreductase [Thermobaculum terrenum]ACZ43672.1 Luciferase-like monooxygenase [Thermobaculum terrenum ATCC BAA-798]